MHVTAGQLLGANVHASAQVVTPLVVNRAFVRYAAGRSAAAPAAASKRAAAEEEAMQLQRLLAPGSQPASITPAQAGEGSGSGVHRGADCGTSGGEVDTSVLSAGSSGSRMAGIRRRMRALLSSEESSCGVASAPAAVCSMVASGGHFSPQLPVNNMQQPDIMGYQLPAAAVGVSALQHARELLQHRQGTSLLSSTNASTAAAGVRPKFLYRSPLPARLQVCVWARVS